MDSLNQFFGENAHLTEEAVSLYVDALKLRRVESLPSTILEHVESCQYCKEEITGLFSLLAEEDYSNTGPHPYLDLTGRTTKGQGLSILKIAATVIAIIGVGLLAYVSFFRTSHNTDGPQSQTSAISVDTTSTKPANGENSKALANGQRLIAARFKESSELEELLRGPTRFAETQVQWPTNGSTIHRGSIFRWTTPTPPPYDITILDNRRHVVLSFQQNSNEFTLKDSLQGGLYYWKLAAEENLLHAGKFIVQ